MPETRCNALIDFAYCVMRINAYRIVRCVRFGGGGRLSFRAAARIVAIQRQQMTVVAIGRLLLGAIIVLLMNLLSDSDCLVIVHLADARIFAVCVATQFRFETIVLDFGGGFTQITIHLLGIHRWQWLTGFH